MILIALSWIAEILLIKSSCWPYIWQVYIKWELKSEKYIVLSKDLGTQCWIFASNPSARFNFGVRVLRCSSHSRFSCSITPRYLTLLERWTLWPLIQKFMCLVIFLCLGLNITISVLVAFKLILFALSHCINRARSWFIQLLIFLKTCC